MEELQQQQLDSDLGYLTTDRKNGNIIKRTKSFWKFGKGDDILEGMAMWRHRDLVAPDGDWDQDAVSQIDESTLRRTPRRQILVPTTGGEEEMGSAHSSETLKQGNVEEQHTNEHRKSVEADAAHKYRYSKAEIDHRVSTMQQTQHRHQSQVSPSAAPTREYPPQEEEDENIYDVQPKSRQQQPPIAVTQVMSRGKVLRQAYLEGDLDLEEELVRSPSTRLHQQQSQQSQQQQENYRRSKNDQGNYKNNNLSTNAQAITATSTAKKKKKPTSKTSAPAVEHMEYYAVRAETPDTINQDEIFKSTLLHENTVRMRDTDFYDDESGDDSAMMMKTVKRQDILKQYYNSSGSDDTEQNSTSSDAYDCIVVEDHHVVRRSGNGQAQVDANNKSAKMEFKTFRGGSDDKDSGMESSRPGTMLPRTKLTKTNSNGNSANTAAVAPIASKNDKQKRSRTERTGKERDERERNTDRNGNRIERSERSSDRHLERSDLGDRQHERGDKHERTPNRKSNGYTSDRHESSGQRHDEYHNSADLESLPSVKSYGPWYDLWGKDISGGQKWDHPPY